MQIFLSYASEDRNLAERIFFALTGEGHRVFFDKESLPSGGDYQTRIRLAVERSDIFLFLTTPRSLAPGSFALSELKYARAKWVHPRDRVIPIVVDVANLDTIPQYLQAVTYVQPEGDIGAETALAVAELEKTIRSGWMRSLLSRLLGGLPGRAALGFGALLAAAVPVYLLNFPLHQDRTRSEVSSRPSSGTETERAFREAGDTLVFSDDFSEGLRRYWQPVSGQWTVNEGRLTGIGDHYVVSGGRNWAAITLNKSIPSDCIVSFNVRIVKGSTAELMLHLSRNKYVRAYIYAVDQSVALGAGTFVEDNQSHEIGMKDVFERVGGGPTVAQQNFPITNGAWYSVMASAIGKQYVIKVGGQIVIDHVDRAGTLSREGAIGFITNGHIEIDDVEIRSQDTRSVGR